MSLLAPLEVSRCGGDSAQLEMHQPDEGQPRVLLGVCPICRVWHVLVWSGRPAGWRVAARLRTADMLSGPSGGAAQSL